ncbi:MAG: PilZ domain-containing protein [Proteobacteria bacterium]|nr:PilZ domain-containing protein [Pseudomonadota bacterium]
MSTTSQKSAGAYEYRRDRRLSLLRLTLETDGVEYNSFDWSLGGIRIEGIIPQRRLEDNLTVVVSGERKGKLLSLETTAMIVRINHDDGETALRFVDLSMENLDVLEALITGRRISS